MNSIRVRFAPSPTGYLHVGGARTALFNWLFARRHGGVFLLRIEDTDVERSSQEMVEGILESLRWLGLPWDEGPYYQSQRLELYRATAQRLEEAGYAYRCYCTLAELSARRAEAEAAGRPWKYDRRCLLLSPQDREQRKAENHPFAVRFQVPPSGTTKFHDQVCGEVEFANEQIEDFVLLRSDGLPTYHLSVVADDLEMRITHVIRGADHLSNTPKQILLYRAMGAMLPVFAHVPLILGPDRSRLSKRHGATAVGAYREQGILPEAMRNFLALLGWSPGDNRERLRTPELIQAFSLEGISKSAAVFDLRKLEWFNTEYMRLLEAEELEPLAAEELRREGCWNSAWEGQQRPWFLRTLNLLKPRLRTLKDLTGSFRAFFADAYPWDPAAVEKFWKDPRLAELLPLLAEELERLETFDASQAEAALRALAEKKEVKAAVLINAARVALTGQGVAPSLFAMMELFGQQRSVMRLRAALAHWPTQAG